MHSSHEVNPFLELLVPSSINPAITTSLSFLCFTSLQHIDYPRLGKLMGSRPIHIHFGQNDTVVAPFCSAYMHRKWKVLDV